MTFWIFFDDTFVCYELQVFMNLWVRLSARNSFILCCQGLVQQRTHVNFPEFDPGLGLLASGLGLVQPAELHCAFFRTDTGMLAPEVTVDESTSP
ncbi:hypothetical protein Tco_0319338 [Tanacetum coccineum]